MRPAEISSAEPRYLENESGQEFDARSRAIFENSFDFFGTLDPDGRILMLHGRIFQRTNTNTTLLIGQRFSETVFWQSSENTARLVDKAVNDTAGGRESNLIVDFRISAEE